MTVAILIGLGIGFGFAGCILYSRWKRSDKPAHFRIPIRPGCFRLVACDEMGGAELNRVVDDFSSFEEAAAEAVRERADSELLAGRRGNPTKFLIYDHSETFVGDWTGRRKIVPDTGAGA
ncbi:MAG: hypothetical protein WC881_08045 [Elusimicrobiota bacterium]|jgi:hypothetical protein